MHTGVLVQRREKKAERSLGKERHSSILHQPLCHQVAMSLNNGQRTTFSCSAVGTKSAFVPSWGCSCPANHSFPKEARTKHPCLLGSCVASQSIDPKRRKWRKGMVACRKVWVPSGLSMASCDLRGCLLFLWNMDKGNSHGLSTSQSTSGAVR